MKKLLSIFLTVCLVTSLAACGGSATPDTGTTAAPAGNAPAAPEATGDRGGSGSGQYKESPEVTKLVEAGTLPPIEERLPKEPAVVEVKEIGKYGGVYKGAAFGPSHGQLDTEALRYGALLTVENDFKSFKPHLIKDYDVNGDYTEYTINLREGHKWSDGSPLTTDDFMFWYEDILCNEDVTPAPATQWMTNGNLMEFEQVSPTQLKIKFTDPYPAFEIVMAKSNADDRRHFLAPKEYLKQWHIKYNPDAEALAKQEGFETWSLCFLEHLANSQKQNDTNAPDVFAWVLSDIDTDGNKIFSRNPYYHVVDQEGNQLPYIDQQMAVLVQDAQVRTMKLISGELHAAGENPLPVKDYTLYKENEAKGDYTVYLFDNTRGSDNAFTFNLNHKDPVLREIFNNLKFREAMSLAINRDEINTTLYFSKANVRMGTVSPNVSFMDPKWEKYMTEYDVDRANALLDELGYNWNASKTIRVMPNGQEFNLVLETIEEFVPVSEMVVEYWSAVGVRTQLKQQERTFYLERGKSNDRDISAFTLGNVGEFGLRSNSFGSLRPGGAFDDLQFMQEYKLWFDHNGTQGEEPTAEIKALRDKCLEFGTLAADDPRYESLGKEILDEVNGQLWYIGTSVAPRVVIISNKLGNTPTEGIFADDYNFWKPFRGDTWFFK